MNKSQAVFVALLSASTALIAGCSLYHTELYTRPPLGAVIDRADIRIVQIDGLWSATGGQEFVPPFTCKPRYGVLPSADQYGWGSWCKDPRMTHVRVEVENRPPLYGIITFYNVNLYGTNGHTDEPLTIRIPDEYIENAGAGNLSLVYQSYKPVDLGPSTLWALWLNNQPLWQ